MMKLNALLNLFATMLIIANCSAQDWTPLWKSYAAAFMDNQVRVIDHDAGDRTTSEGQAYGMFFALVANDRAHFDGLLHWTVQNLAAGDLSTNLHSWLWGHNASNQWGVIDNNSASDEAIWIAYTAQHGFVPDWTDFKTNSGLQPFPTVGSYDAIRVYLWVGMLNRQTKGRDTLLKSISGMENYLRTNSLPPAKVRPDGSVEDPK